MSLLTPSLTESREAHTHSGQTMVPDVSRGERHRSFDVGHFPPPTGREEEWRFTPLDLLGGVLSDAPTNDSGDDSAADFAVDAPDDVLRPSLGPGQAPRGTVLVPEDRAAAVASANTGEALHLAIPAEAVLTDPVRVTVTGSGRAITSTPATFSPSTTSSCGSASSAATRSSASSGPSAR